MLDRRSFLHTGLVTVGSLLGSDLLSTDLLGADPAETSGLRIATFRGDVTPPMGHSLCGGWIKPVEVVDDPLEALGVVILGAGKPIVVCAVDWTGLLNSAHLAWRKALAEAVGTTPDRVAVQCVHQHNAPFACLDAQKIVAQYKELPAIVDPAFFETSLAGVAKAARESLASARPLTAIATGEGTVSQVAGNRRHLGPDGKVSKMRGSACTDPALRALPEGLIDPQLKTVAFYSGEKKVASCHYYACHPMSYYGDGRVSADFCGLARKAHQKTDPDCLHLYFTGASGNIAAGKYNDGSKEMRPVLVQRMLDGIVASEQALKPMPIGPVSWKTAEFLPAPDPRWDAAQLRAQIADPKQPVVNRNRPSYTLAWLERCAAAKEPILLSALKLGDVTLLHLPAESFIEYQLAAQQIAPSRFVAVAAYGDGGPWYIPTEAAFPQGGYEVSVSWSSAAVEGTLRKGIETLS